MWASMGKAMLVLFILERFLKGGVGGCLTDRNDDTPICGG